MSRTRMHPQSIVACANTRQDAASNRNPCMSRIAKDLLVFLPLCKALG